MRILLLILAMFLVGCANITSGDICGKHFAPAHVETSFSMDADGNMSFDSDHIPDRWYITFRRMDESSGKWITRQIEVDKGTYDGFQLGDYFSLD